MLCSVCKKNAAVIFINKSNDASQMEGLLPESTGKPGYHERYPRSTDGSKYAGRTDGGSEPYHRLSFDLDAQIIRTHKANSICFRVTINKALRH